MSREFATAFYHSPAWLHNRKAYMEMPIDTAFGIVPPGMCERCYERGDLVPAKVVHHKIHLSTQNINDPKVTLGFDNFMRLCQDCHAAVHKGYDPPRVAFDEHGNVVRR